MTNPYKKLEDHCFWSRAMLTPHPGQIDPVVEVAHILPQHKVATMGSCFAQHLAKHIQSSGLNYYVSENAPQDMSAEIAKQYNYGVFSARYGNVYTVRQAVQLFDRAFGNFVPQDDVWGKDDGFVDAFRPQIQPESFKCALSVKAAAQKHLEFVRNVFTECL